MKKTLLCGLALVVAFSASAQQQRFAQATKLVPVAGNKSYKATMSFGRSQNVDNFTPARPVAAPMAAAHAKTSSVTTDAIIGSTEYDLQSNRGPARRIINYGGGNLSAVWTGSADRNGYPDRGTFYNHANGGVWGSAPTARVETQRTGFTNIASGNGNEYVLTHNGTSVGVLNKSVIGSNSWTEYSNVGAPLPAGGSDVWWRLAVGGPDGNTVHAIVNSQGSGTTPVLGQNGPLTYSRSLDGGVTWDMQHVVIPGTDSSFYAGVSAENYSIDCNGSTVVIVFCDLMTDVVMLKSTDNGTTWVKTILDPAAIPAYNTASDFAPLISDADGDGVADTILTNAGDPNVTVDASGMAHVTWSLMSALDDDTTAGTSLGIFLTTDGIVYWNESMSAPIIAAGMPDANGDGVLTLPEGNGTDLPFGRYGNSGLSIHPQIGFGDGGQILLVYDAPSELTDTTIYLASLRHVYIVSSCDNGANWTAPHDIINFAATGGDGEFQEGVWPSIAKNNDANTAYIVYQRDATPEYNVNNTATSYGPLNTTTNDIVVAAVPTADFICSIGVNEVASQSSSFTVSQNFPNPFNGVTQFDVNLKKGADVRVDVYNVIGKLVKSHNYTNLNKGVNTLTLDAAGLSAGMYTYSVVVGAEKVTKSMMVK